MNRRENQQMRNKLQHLQKRGDQFTRLLIQETQREVQLDEELKNMSQDFIRLKESSKQKAVQLRERQNELYSTLNSSLTTDDDPSRVGKAGPKIKGDLNSVQVFKADGHNATRSATEDQAKLVRILELRVNKILVKQNEAQRANIETKALIDKYRFQAHNDTLSLMQMKERLENLEEEMKRVMSHGEGLKASRDLIEVEEEELKHQNTKEIEEFVKKFNELKSQVDNKAELLTCSIAAAAKDVIKNAKKVEEGVKSKEEDNLSTSNINHMYIQDLEGHDGLSAAQSSYLRSNTAASEMTRLDTKLLELEKQKIADMKLLSDTHKIIEAFDRDISKIQALSGFMDPNEIIYFFNKQEDEAYAHISHVQEVDLETELIMDQIENAYKEKQAFCEDLDRREEQREFLREQQQIKFDEALKEGNSLLEEKNLKTQTVKEFSHLFHTFLMTNSGELPTVSPILNIVDEDYAHSIIKKALERADKVNNFYQRRAPKPKVDEKDMVRQFVTFSSDVKEYGKQQDQLAENEKSTPSSLENLTSPRPLTDAISEKINSKSLP